MSVVSFSVDEHVAHVTLNRPGKKNAINMEMFEALAAVGDEITADRSIRCVVLSGAGGCFCAGIDTDLFAGSGAGISATDMAPAGNSPANRFQRAAWVWREVPVPVICAIDGVAFGGGLQIALGADLRYATPDARLAVMEIAWGIIPDMAITATARHLLALDQFAELAWTGRVVAADEARALGLVTAVHENVQSYAAARAREIAGRSPDAVRAIKRLSKEAWSAPVEQALELEATLQSGLLGAPNQLEAVAANMQNRAPGFAD